MSRNPEDGEPTIDIPVRTPSGDAIWPVQSTSAIENAITAGLQIGVDANGFYVRNWGSFEEDFASIDDAAQAFLDGID